MPAAARDHTSPATPPPPGTPAAAVATTAELSARIAQLVRDTVARPQPWASAIEALRTRHGIAEDVLLRVAAAHFGMRPMLATDLQALQPAFEVISYVEAGERQCAAFQLTANVLLLAVADPIDQRLRLWIDRKLRKLALPRVEWGLTSAAHLSAYKVPHSVRLVDRIPRTGSGKIQRFELQKLLG